MIMPNSDAEVLGCPDRSVWRAFQNGRLPEPTLERLGRHLNSCPDCLARQDLYRDDADFFVAEIRGMSEAKLQRNAETHRARELDTSDSPDQPFGDSENDLSDSAAADPTLGELGQYQLLEKLGSGGMGKVFKARHRLMNRIVALKVIQDRRLSDPGAVHRFRKEIRALAQLDHPRIVRALDADLAGDTLFLVMEYVEGIDLAQWVATRGPLPVAQACAFISQAAFGLQHAHERSLVHRDLKPSNLMVTPSGQVKLLDLGLALFRPEWPPKPESGALGVVLGSVDYMAPEQWRDSQAVDIRADLYSLGCTLYHLLAGHPPFQGPAYVTLEQKLNAHCRVQPPGLRGLRPDIPAPLLEVLQCLLAKDPAQRFATPAIAQKALAPFVEGNEHLGKPSPLIVKKPRRRPPEERFWKRYSRHHELPLSVASSVFLHALGLGALALILTGTLLGLLGMKNERLPIEAIQVAGGGGNELGSGNGPANGAIPAGPESLKEPSAADAKMTTPASGLPQPRLDRVPEHTALRPFEEAPLAASSRESGADQRLRDRIRDLMAGKGKGGQAGGGGGEGRGQGIGVGNNRGPGVDSGNLSVRQKRQLRWSMVFSRRDGEDYLHQLIGLGAILAVPTANDDYMFYRDLKQRPPQGQQGSLAQMNQIYWTDTDSGSVRALLQALGLPAMPADHVIAFFPLELEKQLLEKERRAYSGDENNIRETIFRVQKRGRNFEPIVESVDVGKR
jgi:serine/threonine protein kinase